MSSAQSDLAIRRILSRSMQNVPAEAASSAAADRALRTLGSPGGGRATEAVSRPVLAAVKSEVTYMVNGLLLQAGIPARVAGAALALAVVFAITWAVVSLVPEKPPVPVYPAIGFVTFGRTIPTGAQVYLHPRSGELPESAVPRGTVAADGSVAFTTYPQAAGVPAGDYVAIVHWYRSGKDSETSRNVVPARYLSPKTSPLAVSITAGVNDPFPLRLMP